MGVPGNSGGVLFLVGLGLQAPNCGAEGVRGWGKGTPGWHAQRIFPEIQVLRSKQKALLSTDLHAIWYQNIDNFKRGDSFKLWDDRLISQSYTYTHSQSQSRTLRSQSHHSHSQSLTLTHGLEVESSTSIRSTITSCIHAGAWGVVSTE